MMLLQGQPAYKVRVSTDELKAVVDAQLDDISTLVKVTHALTTAKRVKQRA